MGYLVAAGFLLAISMVLGVVGLVLGLWLGHIILFDSIVLGIVTGMCCYHFAHIHPALCLVIGIVVCLLLLFLQNTTIGFWVIGGLFTLLYSTFFGLLGVLLTDRDMIWGWVVFGLSLVIIGGLHLKARDQV